MASGLSGYIISCLQETFTVLWNVAHRQSDTYDTQMNQNRIYCKQRSVHLLVVPVVRIQQPYYEQTWGGYPSGSLTWERWYMDRHKVRTHGYILQYVVRRVSTIHCPGK